MGKENISFERGNRLQNIRKKAGLTRLEFSEKTGISPNTLKAIELGERELTPQKALLFSNLFASLFAVSLGEDAHEARFDYLFYGKIEDNAEINKVNSDDDERLQSTINFFSTNTGYLITTIPDNLMSPFYNEGDIVCGRKVINKSQFSLFHGHICILEALNGDKMVRRIIKAEGQKVTSYILNTNANHNSNLVEDIEVSSLAQAIWHWRISELVQNPPLK
jgi:transcriptional regulator with XRE-family HTH domain